MSGSGIAPLSTCSRQNVKIGTPYQRPPFISTKLNVLNSSPVSSLLFAATTLWWGGWCPGEGPLGSCGEVSWRGESHNNQGNMCLLPTVSLQQELLQPPLPHCFFPPCLTEFVKCLRIHHHHRWCHWLWMEVWRQVHQALRRCRLSLWMVGILSWASRSLFWFSFSCSSLSSMSASPIGRVHDQYRRDLSLLSWLSWLWRGVTCVLGIVVINSEDAKRRRLYAGVACHQLLCLLSEWNT